MVSSCYLTCERFIHAHLKQVLMKALAENGIKRQSLCYTCRSLCTRAKSLAYETSNQNICPCFEAYGEKLSKQLLRGMG